MSLTYRLVLVALAASLCTIRPAYAQAIVGSEKLRGNFAESIDRPLRYRPDGDAFVIENGRERFNRPLYGGNTAFRVDAGDRPEFVLYLPGRGGNLRFAMRDGSGRHWWLHDAEKITSRYRPGEYEYQIRDPRLGGGTLELQVLALAATEGLIVRARGVALPRPAELFFVFGGVNGQRGVRDGDIGTERVPISQWFGFEPAFAKDNRVALSSAGGFTLGAKAGVLTGVISGGAATAVAAGEDWNDAARLFGSQSQGTTAQHPVVTGVLRPGSGDAYLLIQRTAYGEGANADLSTYAAVSADQRKAAQLPPLLAPVQSDAIPILFANTREHFAGLRNRVRVETPDPWLNNAVAALGVAGDAVWDGPEQAIMHGAIAWRTKLLGWRGPYVLDALGWHDRAKANFRAWFPRQNVSPVPAKIPPPDEDSNLARSEAALHSTGDLSNSHYDMNAVFIDALFRHLRWTGDVDFAREAWPVIERHLAWERRLFRRPFGPKRLPLYEAYAQIWASDDVQYNGGGVAYASAYNLFHNREAARIARLIGRDPAPYHAEAAAIDEAMKAFLWMPQQGRFAEYRDWLGNQLLHPSAGLWSFYHVVDSEAVDARDAWRMGAGLGRAVPWIPVKGAGVPGERAHGVYATSEWMPYSWSVNNVVMGENLHAALGLWQAGQADAAYGLAKSAMLASMYMGISPGNVGTMNYLDVYRREAQRDFADGSGTMSRAIVEGLFGVRPDAMNKRLHVRPGFPADWAHARLDHPDVGVGFRRTGNGECWTVTQAGDTFRTVELRVPARLERVASVTVDGRPARWRVDPDAVAAPAILIAASLGRKSVVDVRWGGRRLPAAATKGSRFVERRQGEMRWWQPIGAELAELAEPQVVDAAPTGSQRAVTLDGSFNDNVSAIFAQGKYRSPRSPFVSLALPAQGLGAWAGHVKEWAEIDDRGLRKATTAGGGWLTLPDGGKFRTPASGRNVVFVSQYDNYPKEKSVPLSGSGKFLRLLMAGTTYAMQSRMDNGEVIVTYADGGTERLALHNPTTWWPIERDYLIDDYQFRTSGPRPLRVDLATARVRRPGEVKIEGGDQKVPGGSATVLGVRLDPNRKLRSLTVRALSNEVVIGLLAATVEE